MNEAKKKFMSQNFDGAIIMLFLGFLSVANGIVCLCCWPAVSDQLHAVSLCNRHCTTQAAKTHRIRSTSARTEHDSVDMQNNGNERYQQKPYEILSTYFASASYFFLSLLFHDQQLAVTPLSSMPRARSPPYRIDSCISGVPHLLAKRFALLHSLLPIQFLFHTTTHDKFMLDKT